MPFSPKIEKCNEYEWITESEEETDEEADCETEDEKFETCKAEGEKSETCKAEGAKSETCKAEGEKLETCQETNQEADERTFEEFLAYQEYLAFREYLLHRESLPYQKTRPKVNPNALNDVPSWPSLLEPISLLKVLFIRLETYRNLLQQGLTYRQFLGFACRTAKSSALTLFWRNMNEFLSSSRLVLLFVIGPYFIYTLFIYPFWVAFTYPFVMFWRLITKSIDFVSVKLCIRGPRPKSKPKNMKLVKARSYYY